MKPIRPVTPEEAIEALKAASEALSHASYCTIVGMRPQVEAIQDPWDALMNVLNNFEPPETFEPVEPNPTLKIVTFDFSIEAQPGMKVYQIVRNGYDNNNYSTQNPLEELYAIETDAIKICDSLNDSAKAVQRRKYDAGVAEDRQRNAELTALHDAGLRLFSPGPYTPNEFKFDPPFEVITITLEGKSNEQPA